MKRLLLVVVALFASLAFGQAHSVTLTCTAPPIPSVDLQPPVAQPVTLLFTFLRGTVTGGPYTSVGTSSTCKFTDSSSVLVGGTKFFYVVTASLVNSVGTSAPSAFSNEVTANIPGTAPGTAPAAPTLSGTVQ